MIKNLSSQFYAVIIGSALFFTTTSCSKEDISANVHTTELNQKELSDIKSFNKQIFSTLEEISKDQDLKDYYYSKQNDIKQVSSVNQVSPAFNNYLLAIKNSSGFNTPNKYLNYLNDLVKDAMSDSDLLPEELKSIIMISKSLEEFIAQGNVYYSSKKTLLAKAASSDKGWWESWGKCAAGIIGGAGLGGLAGAAVTSPTVVGIPVGTAVGVVSGALSGAAATC